MGRKKYYAEHSLYVYGSLAVVGGFLETFTYFHHAGVFSNAQTGNVVLMAVELAGGEFMQALMHLISIAAYVLGILLSAILIDHVRPPHRHCLVCLGEIIWLCLISLFPETWPHVVTYASVSLLCGLQYNIFTECHDTVLATTFCTNSLRQLTLNLYNGILSRDSAKLRKSGVYALIVLFFAAGAVGGALVVQTGLGNLSVFFCAAFLVPVFAVLLNRCIRAGKKPCMPEEGV